MQTQSTSTNSRSKNLLIVLLVFEALLAAIFLFDKWNPGQTLFNPDWFKMDGEKNIPAYFSGLQLFIVGMLFLVVAFGVARVRLASSIIFLILSALFVFLAIDESFMIHEKIQFSYRRGKYQEYEWMIPTVKKHYGAWMSIYLMLGALMSVVLAYPLIRMLREFPRPASIMAVGFSVFLLGAVGMELLAYIFFWGDAGEANFGPSHNFIERHLIALEEFLEMSGISIVLYGLLQIRPHEARIRSA